MLRIPIKGCMFRFGTLADGNAIPSPGGWFFLDSTAPFVYGDDLDRISQCGHVLHGYNFETVDNGTHDVDVDPHVKVECVSPDTMDTTTDFKDPGFAVQNKDGQIRKIFIRESALRVVAALKDFTKVPNDVVSWNLEYVGTWVLGHDLAYNASAELSHKCNIPAKTRVHSDQFTSIKGALKTLNSSQDILHKAHSTQEALHFAIEPVFNYNTVSKWMTHCLPTRGRPFRPDVNFSKGKCGNASRLLCSWVTCNDMENYAVISMSQAKPDEHDRVGFPNPTTFGLVAIRLVINEQKLEHLIIEDITISPEYSNRHQAIATLTQALASFCAGSRVALGAADSVMEPIDAAPAAYTLWPGGYRKLEFKSCVRGKLQDSVLNVRPIAIIKHTDVTRINAIGDPRVAALIAAAEDGSRLITVMNTKPQRTALEPQLMCIAEYLCGFLWTRDAAHLPRHPPVNAPITTLDAAIPIVPTLLGALHLHDHVTIDRLAPKLELIELLNVIQYATVLNVPLFMLGYCLPEKLAQQSFAYGCVAAFIEHIVLGGVMVELTDPRTGPVLAADMFVCAWNSKLRACFGLQLQSAKPEDEWRARMCQLYTDELLSARDLLAGHIDQSLRTEFLSNLKRDSTDVPAPSALLQNGELAPIMRRLYATVASHEISVHPQSLWVIKNLEMRASIIRYAPLFMSKLYVADCDALRPSGMHLYLDELVTPAIARTVLRDAIESGILTDIQFAALCLHLKKALVKMASAQLADIDKSVICRRVANLIHIVGTSIDATTGLVVPMGLVDLARTKPNYLKGLLNAFPTMCGVAPLVPPLVLTPFPPKASPDNAAAVAAIKKANDAKTIEWNNTIITELVMRITVPPEFRTDAPARRGVVQIQNQYDTTIYMYPPIVNATTPAYNDDSVGLVVASTAGTVLEAIFPPVVHEFVKKQVFKKFQYAPNNLWALYNACLSICDVYDTQHTIHAAIEDTTLDIDGFTTLCTAMKQALLRSRKPNPKGEDDEIAKVVPELQTLTLLTGQKVGLIDVASAMPQRRDVLLRLFPTMRGIPASTAPSK